MKHLIEGSHSFLHIALYVIKSLVFRDLIPWRHIKSLINRHSHPFSCTQASQKSTSVWTWYSVGQDVLISPGFVSANKQVCRRGKAKSIGIWRRMEKIPIPLFLLHSDFFTEMFGYLYSYYYGANINSGWNKIFQIHQCMKISTPYHNY